MLSPVIAGQAPSVDYNITHDDPASDVEWLYPNGTTELKDGPKDFNLKRVVSEDLGIEVKFRLELVGQGAIRDHPNATYSVLIATINNTTSDLIINYTDGTCEMFKVPSYEKVETVLKYKLSEGKKAGEALLITVPKSVFGEPLVFEIAGKVKYHEELDEIGEVTYTDYVWTLSGNPGSTPDDPTEPNGGSGDSIGSWVYMVGAIIVLVIILAAGLLYFEHKRR